MSVIAVLTSYVSLSRGQCVKAFVRIRIIFALCTTSGRSTLCTPMLLIHTRDIEIVVQIKHSFNAPYYVCYFNYRNYGSFLQIFLSERYQ